MNVLSRWGRRERSRRCLRSPSAPTTVAAPGRPSPPPTGGVTPDRPCSRDAIRSPCRRPLSPTTSSADGSAAVRPERLDAEPYRRHVTTSLDPAPTAPGGGSSQEVGGQDRGPPARRLHERREPRRRSRSTARSTTSASASTFDERAVRAAVGLGQLCHVPLRRRVVHALRHPDEVGDPASRPRRSAHGGSGRRSRGRPPGRPRTT